MRAGLFDLPAGISGDMWLGALVGAGASLDVMRAAVRAAAGEDVSLEGSQVRRGGLVGTRVEVRHRGVPVVESGGPFVEASIPSVTGSATVGGAGARPVQDSGEGRGPHGSSQGGDSSLHAAHAHHPDPSVIARIENAELEPAVRARALAAFRALGEAEARVHGTPLPEVHFHEVGSLDAIADVVGAAAGLESLSLDRLYHGAIGAGGGAARTGHGIMPLPAPATLELLRGRVCLFEDGAGEWVTPTGAALLAAWAEPLPAGLALRPERVGYGAGRADPPHRPNLARLTVGELDRMAERRTRVAVVEASLDDATPEEGGHLVQALLAAGAFDATLTPLIMKKGRPGFLIRVLCPPEEGSAFAERVVTLSPSLGARWRVEERLELDRREDRVRLASGEVRVKVALLPQGRERPHPEYEDVARMAAASGRSFSEIAADVLRVWREGRG